MPSNCAFVVCLASSMHGYVHNSFNDVYPTTVSWTAGEEDGEYLGHYKYPERAIFSRRTGDHTRDYSPWFSWGALADDQYPCLPSLLSRALTWKGEGERAIGIAQGDWRAVGGSGRLFIVSTQVTMNLNRYTVHGMMAVGGRR